MRSALLAIFVLAPAVAFAQPGYDEAVAARLDGRHAEAVRLFEPLSKEYPQNADIWLMLGLSYTAVGRLDEARDALAQARTLAPDYQDVIDAQNRLSNMTDPRSPEARIRAAREAGRHDEALQLLEPMSREQPENADVWLLLGLTYTALGRLDEADAALAQAQTLAPDYQDVTAARARLVQMRRGGPPKWRIDAVGGYSSLTSGLEPWRLASLHVTRKLENTWLTVGAEHSDRFGQSDLYIEGLAAHDFSGWTGYAAVGGTPDADHRAEVAVRGGAMLSPTSADGWNWRPGVDVSWARYSVGDVSSIQPGLTLENRRLSLRARWIATWDEFDDFRSGYALDGWWQVADRWRLMASWADAAESSEGTTIDTQAVSLGVAVDINDATAIRLDVVHEARDAYDRDTVALGLTRRF